MDFIESSTLWVVARWFRWLCSRADVECSAESSIQSSDRFDEFLSQYDCPLLIFICGWGLRLLSRLKAIAKYFSSTYLYAFAYEWSYWHKMETFSCTQHMTSRWKYSVSWLSTDHFQPLMTPNALVIDVVVFVLVSHCCLIVPVQFPCACFERVAPTRPASQSTSNRDRIVVPPYFLSNFPAIFHSKSVVSR